jgi:hypothetical protein
VEVAAVGIYDIEIKGAPVVIVAARRIARRSKDNAPIGQIGRKEIVVGAIFLLVQKALGIGKVT